jgi:hypothetical protein
MHRKDITVAANAGLSHFSQSFDDVPEPLTTLLVGSGLVELSPAGTNPPHRTTPTSPGQPLLAAQALNELPQPQVERTLGLSNLNPEPSSVST